MMRKIWRLSAILATLIVAMVAAVSPASAENATIYSIKVEWSGAVLHLASMKFTADGDKWTVCDLYSDGRRAVGSVYWEDSGGNHIIYTPVTTGYNTCKGASHNFSESQNLILQIWVQDGPDGNREYVGTAEVSAS